LRLAPEPAHEKIDAVVEQGLRQRRRLDKKEPVEIVGGLADTVVQLVGWTISMTTTLVTLSG
jgi:hypothetical protein